MYEIAEKNTNKKIAIVNALSNDFIINTEKKHIDCCYGKNFKNEYNKKIDDFDMIIVYCANFSCNAGEKYLEDLKNISNKPKYYEFKGGILEYALYSLAYKEAKIINKNTNRFMQKNEVYKIIEEYNNAKQNLKKKSSEERSKITVGLNIPFDLKFPL